MPWKPAFPGERPTLGHIALRWMIQNLAQPGVVDYRTFRPTQEQYEFLCKFYEVDEKGKRRVVQRGVLSRARGWGKSPFLSAIALFEGLGPAVPDGFDSDGRPVGKPWASFTRPWVAVAAATEAQTANAWIPLLEMLNENAPVLGNYPGLEPLSSRVNLPYGFIEPVFPTPTSTKGAPWTFCIADQTEQWLPVADGTRGGPEFMRTIRSNVVKIPGHPGSLIESPNAYTPGRNSVAEASAKAFFAQREGRAKAQSGLYYDHREAPADTSLTERSSLEYGLRFAYGCSSADPRGCVLHDPPCKPGWADIDSRINDIWAEDTEEQDARADFLNQITFATDSWLSSPEWTACRDTSKHVGSEDAVVLGFDGSRGKAKGKPDATALVGCRVSDGHMFVVGLWEAPNQKEAWPDWQPPLPEIEERIARAYREWNVVGMYCDPARDWRSYVNKWESEYAKRTKVKKSVRHPMEYWMLGGKAKEVEASIEALESAIRHGDMTHSGDDRLTRHILSARRRLSNGHLRLDKESSYSINKIDLAVAAVLAWQCRNDALAAGHGRQRVAQSVGVMKEGVWGDRHRNRRGPGLDAGAPGFQA